MRASPSPFARLLVLALLVAAGPAAAQNARVAADPGPHYVGDAISIRVTAEGFDEEPTPKVSVPMPGQGRLELVSVSPNVSQSITIVNGRMTRTRQVTHVFQYRYVAERAGRVAIGPFRVEQGASRDTLAALRLEIHEVPSSDDIGVRLKLPEGPIYVGARVPVTVVFTLERNLRKNLLSYALQVPLFDLQDQFRFLDEGPTGGADGGTEVQISTARGQLELSGRARELERGGRSYVEVSVVRTIVPLSAGSFEIPASTLAVEEGLRWRRDFFGGRRATQVRRFRAADRPRTIAVRSLESEGRPPSFSGAIGRGFTLEVRADRTVVQVGDPITLTLTLRGEGLETASLPPLDAEGLLSPDSFRVPSGESTGVIEGTGKRFSVVVRVLDENVDEIPALAYSWFDPYTESYETTTTRPIALAVRSAEVIGAAQVEFGSEGEEADAAGERLAAEPAAPAARSFALSGADLAVERRPERLVAAAGLADAGQWWPALVYVGSALLLPLAVLDRRRRDVDPGVARRRRVLAEASRAIREAVRRPDDPGAVDVVAAELRRMLAEVPDAASGEIDAFLGECDTRRYAPGAATGGSESGRGFLERAAALGERIAAAAP